MISIKKLNKEMYYHPHWIKDKKTFQNFLHHSHFSEQDIITIARLYVKYSHLHHGKQNELSKYFNYILQKMQIYNFKQLFYKSNEIYK